MQSFERVILCAVTGFHRVSKVTALAGGLICLGVVCAQTAEAGLFGSTLSWQYYAYGGPYLSGGQSGGSFVVNGGIGGTFIGQTPNLYFNILADDTSITFDYSIYNGSTASPWSSSGLSLAPTIYNGVAIDLISGTDFTSVTIDPASNMIGFDSTRVSFTATQIQVDWQNLSFNSSTIVKLDINPVPEPSTCVLVSLGFAAFTIYRRRK